MKRRSKAHPLPCRQMMTLCARLPESPPPQAKKKKQV